jgi:hypothetical protein
MRSRSPNVFVTISERIWHRTPTLSSTGTTNQSFPYSSAAAERVGVQVEVRQFAAA